MENMTGIFQIVAFPLPLPEPWGNFFLGSSSWRPREISGGKTCGNMEAPLRLLSPGVSHSHTRWHSASISSPKLPFSCSYQLWLHRFVLQVSRSIPSDGLVEQSSDILLLVAMGCAKDHHTVLQGKETYAANSLVQVVGSSSQPLILHSHSLLTERVWYYRKKLVLESNKLKVQFWLLLLLYLWAWVIYLMSLSLFSHHYKG